MPSIKLLAVLASLALAACAGKPDATECASGITCPEGTKCAAAQAVCITNNCGDGVVQQSEKCDDGNILDGDGCAANCLSSEVCGDNVLNSAAGEVCDDGNMSGGDGCSMDCRSVEICGNGIRDVNEVCDDNNTVPGDGCSGNCKSTEVCGNGIVDINEKCDDSGTPGGCNDDCQGGTGCRDGAIDKDGAGHPLEECDDGNMENQDDCTFDCHLNHCGDGIQQTMGTRIEGCDPAVNFGETMGCNIDCTVTVCGDGKINNTALEQCDDENVVDTDACKNDCKLNVCGDGVEGGPNEACDTGGSSTTCNADCTLPDCGDGFVNIAAGEDCDPGGGNTPMNTATCDANCTVPVCGDGTTNMLAGEDCDDMNAVETDNCLSDCTAATCGDGFVDAVAGPKHEVCDDGNMGNESACPYGVETCTLCNSTCQMVENLIGPRCGDLNIDMTFGEMCDDGNRITEANCPYGTPTCTVCAGDCKSKPARTGLFCGDGLPAAGEACDDHNSMACGSCDAGCNVITAAAATGYIVSVSGQEYSDGETITIKDGSSTVVFELDNDNMFTGTRVQFSNGDSATTVAGRLKTQINNSVLAIDAVNNGALVLLTHQRNTSLGNQAITSTVNDNDFSFDGMAGGAGGDCLANVGCMTGADCASNVCTNNQCVGP